MSKQVYRYGVLSLFYDFVILEKDGSACKIVVFNYFNFINHDIINFIINTVASSEYQRKVSGTLYAVKNRGEIKNFENLHR